jgi:VWFA-related protein
MLYFKAQFLRWFFSRILFWIACLAMVPIEFPAQVKQSPEFNVRVDVVSIDVEVLDPTGQPVEDLTAKDFIILENGEKMEIANFSHFRDRPVSLALVLDISTMDAETLVLAKQHILNIIHLLDPGDDICLLTFDQKEVYRETGFTFDRPLLIDALNDLYAANRLWNFLVEFFGSDPPTASGIDMALRSLEKSAHSQKAMLVISNRFKGLGPVTVDHVQKSGCTFYTLVFEHEMAAVATMGGNVINREQMAERTGGREFHADADRVMHVSRNIAVSLKNYYSIGYRTEINPEAEGARKIEVRVPGREFTINARTSYFPDSDTKTSETAY